MPKKNEVLILCHMPHEKAGTIEDALSGAGLAFRYVELFREIPESLPLDQIAGMILLGGAMNVDQTEQYPFLAKDVEWIRQAIEIQLPLMGICLGAQLIAKALGARVYPNGVKEIGWYPIEFTKAAAEDPLFAQRGTRTIFQWHGDTFDLPEGTVHLAKSLQCKNQAFRYGSNAYGLQFHPEMTASMVDSWLNTPSGQEELSQLDYIDPQQITALTPQELPIMQAWAGEVFGRFAQMCRE
jgi:GMP synthase (glutamine-hydrolysing)